MTPADPLVAKILGCDPPAEGAESSRVQAHVAALLAPGERFVAGLDTTWFDTGTRGVVLTDRRVFRYRGAHGKDVVALADVARVRTRRMWYPSAGLLGRGDVGAGPVVILRLRFTRHDGGRARLRLQDFAGALAPFVAGLVAAVGRDRVDVARTLPGL